jgi:hypothetical protein
MAFVESMQQNDERIKQKHADGQAADVYVGQNIYYQGSKGAGQIRIQLE